MPGLDDPGPGLHSPWWAGWSMPAQVRLVHDLLALPHNPQEYSVTIPLPDLDPALVEDLTRLADAYGPRGVHDALEQLHPGVRSDVGDDHWQAGFDAGRAEGRRDGVLAERTAQRLAAGDARLAGARRLLEWWRDQPGTPLPPGRLLQVDGLTPDEVDRLRPADEDPWPERLVMAALLVGGVLLGLLVALLHT